MKIGFSPDMRRWVKGKHVLDLRLTCPEGQTVVLKSKKEAEFSPGIIRRAEEIIALWTGFKKEGPRELLAEWWEIWWRKDGERSVMLWAEGEGERTSLHIPRGVFAVRADAVATMAKEKCAYHVLIHVKRYRRKKGTV